MQHLLVDRYIQGRLEGSEKDAFEERLVWDEALVDEVELAERLQDGLKEAVSSRAENDEPSGFNPIAVLTGFFAVPQFAAAASFLLAVALTVGVFMSPIAGPGARPDIPELKTDIIPLFATRSENAMEVMLNRDAWTILLVDVIGDYPAYRVTVRRDEPDADPVWMQDGLTPTYPDSLAVGLPGDSLAAGRYVLAIDGVISTGANATMYEQVQQVSFEATQAD